MKGELDPYGRNGPDGWYRNEQDPTGKTVRYWTGRQWTGQTRAATAAELPPKSLGTAPPSPEERQRIATEQAAIAREQAATMARARLAAISNSRKTRDLASVRSFEYSIVELSPETAEARLSEAGCLGWELVNVLAGRANTDRYYLKREVWTQVDSAGTTTATAPAFGAGTKAAAAGAGGGFFAYFESGPDLDGDGDVDGGLFDSIGGLFE